MFQRVLIAIDMHESSTTVLEVGAALAQALTAQVALVHVVDAGLAAVPEGGLPATELLDDLEQVGQTVLQTARDWLPAGLAASTLLREGTPADEILAAAREWQADLIVLGAHSHRGPDLVQRLISSTTEAVVRHAPCAVLTVPA